MLKFISIS